MAAFSIRSSAIPSHAAVVGFRGVEAISKPYEIDVYFTIAGLDFVDLRDAVYSKAILTVQTDDPTVPFTFGGVLASVQLVRALPGHALYLARLVPQLWQLGLTRHSRIFTKKSIVEVIREVLDEGGVADYELRLEGTFEKEDHICQYKESNLAFLQRWMAREGMYYFFAQTDEGEKLVITNSKTVHPSERKRPVRYFPLSGADGTSRQSFDDFTCTYNALPASVRLLDYDYSKPALDVSGSAPISPTGLGEITSYGQRFFSASEGRRLAQIRAEEFRAHEVVYFARGAADHLHAGFTFDVEDHPNPAFNASYLVTDVTHHGFEPSFDAAWGALVKPAYQETYRVELSAIASDTQYRHPETTPWPHVSGYENANVDGPATSQYAQIDDQGRYLVKFKYDEGSAKDGKASTFVRMVQPHDGPVEGHHFPLRKGVEVICEFLDGDPDRPVIVGSVHNAITPSVVTSSNHTQNVIRTGSQNHLVMEDAAGAMWVDLYCPIFTSTLFLGHGTWNFNLTTQGSGQIQTKVNLNVDVDAEMKVDVLSHVDVDYHSTLDWDVEGVVKVHYHATMDWDVDAAVKIAYHDTFSLKVAAATHVELDATLDVQVTGRATYLFKADVGIRVEGNLDAHVVGNATLTTDGNKTETVHGNVTETIDGSRTVHVKGAQTITVDAPQEWIRMDVHKAMTYGATLDIFLGAKTTMQAGVTVDAFVGMKNSITLGVNNELALTLHNSLTLGVDLSLFAGLKASVAAALQLAISATNVSVTGAALNVTGPSINVSGPMINIIGGPVIDISAVELHI